MRTGLASSILVSILLAIAACSSGPSNESNTTQPPTPKPPANGALWIPAPGTTWQWHLGSPPVDPNLNVSVYDLDLFETDAPLVSTLRQSGKKLICYLSAGSWEEWRPDAADYPQEILGNDYDGWPGEKWLDIRQIDKLAPILRSRLDLCRQKGFDAVEPDNIDGHGNDTGFPITPSDQIAFNVWLAAEAHARGLSIGLKNDGEQAGELVEHFDWAMTEDCFDQGWCADMNVFIEAGKAVFQAEYTDTGVDFGAVCNAAEKSKFSPLHKKRDLDAWLEVCP